MNFKAAIGEQANLPVRHVSHINDTELVARTATETFVAQLERLIVERGRVVPPGNAPALVPKIDERRFQKSRVFFKAGTSDQMWLAQQITQVIVETTGS